VTKTLDGVCSTIQECVIGVDMLRAWRKGLFRFGGLVVCWDPGDFTIPLWGVSLPDADSKTD